MLGAGDTTFFFPTRLVRLAFIGNALGVGVAAHPIVHLAGAICTATDVIAQGPDVQLAVVVTLTRAADLASA
jgi:hypothetical protein